MGRRLGRGDAAPTETLRRYPHIGPVLPAVGYSEHQLRELKTTIDAVDCDVAVAGTPVDLDRLVSCPHPIRQAGVGELTLAHVLEPTIAQLGPCDRQWP